ncbi:MAG: hypothetical protein ACK52J_00805 [bacterium]
MVAPKEHLTFVSSMLKLLCQPFVRKTTTFHSLSAPTHARKIADSFLLSTCS